MLKLLMHYQGLIRVPFIWSDPAAEKIKHLDDRLGSSIDIAPTILYRAGLQPNTGVQGQNLFSENKTRKGLVIEEDSQRKMIGFKLKQLRILEKFLLMAKHRYPLKKSSLILLVRRRYHKMIFRIIMH